MQIEKKIKVVEIDYETARRLKRLWKIQENQNIDIFCLAAWGTAILLVAVWARVLWLAASTAYAQILHLFGR